MAAEKVRLSKRSPGKAVLSETDDNESKEYQQHVLESNRSTHESTKDCKELEILIFQTKHLSKLIDIDWSMMRPKLVPWNTN